MLPLNFKAISLIDWIEVLFISCDTGVGRSNTKILQIHDCHLWSIFKVVSDQIKCFDVTITRLIKWPSSKIVLIICV
jgi:hypothetical protein